MNKTILVTGAQGQVGRALQALATDFPKFNFQFAGREQLDITQQAQVDDYFHAHQPDVCINCAAYTAVDQAESNPEQAFLINEQAVGFLAKACQNQQSHFLHISSDYVYHNSLNRPLRESDPCTPQGIYAQSKLAGDQRALQDNRHTHILRTSWVYDSQGHNFVRTMLRLGQERPQLKIVYDQIGAPTYAPDIAKVLLQLVQQPDTPSGVYNFANSGVTSWYDFARAIFAIKGIDCQVSPIPGSESPSPTSRPHYSLLDTQKIRQALQIDIPHWRSRLQDCLTVR